jgi:hypothetical protein
MRLSRVLMRHDCRVKCYDRIMKGKNVHLAKPKVLGRRTATLLNRRLADKKISRSDLIRLLQTDFEARGESAPSRNHLFKILNGQAVLGERGLTPYIARALGIEMEDIIPLIRADKIEAKGWASAVPKANAVVREIATIMESLNPKDQEEILKFAKMKAGLL